MSRRVQAPCALEHGAFTDSRASGRQPIDPPTSQDVDRPASCPLGPCSPTRGQGGCPASKPPLRLHRACGPAKVKSHHSTVPMSAGSGARPRRSVGASVTPALQRGRSGVPLAYLERAKGVGEAAGPSPQEEDRANAIEDTSQAAGRRASGLRSGHGRGNERGHQDRLAWAGCPSPGAAWDLHEPAGNLTREPECLSTNKD